MAPKLGSPARPSRSERRAPKIVTFPVEKTPEFETFPKEFGVSRKRARKRSKKAGENARKGRSRLSGGHVAKVITDR
jgi:hypothetical protein